MRCSAARGEWEQAESEFEEFLELHRAIDMIEPDIAELTQIVGEQSLSQRPEPARRSLEIAAEVWALLGDGRQAVVEALLEQL